jgi:hypothetical protein
MTLDEQLAWMPRLERIQRALTEIFGEGVELTPLWDDRETWEECARRVHARQAERERRETENVRHGSRVDNARPNRARIVDRPMEQGDLF